MDFFLFHGKIWTGKDSFFDALIVRRGRIAAVGRQQDLYPQAEECSFIDCGGRVVIPGVFDACLCLAAAGTTLPDGIAGLEAACKTWLTAHPQQAKKGAHLFWRSNGEVLPMERLEHIWPDAPLVLEDIAAETCWANRAALERLEKQGIPAACVPFLEFDERGNPAGRFLGPACRLIASMIPRPSQVQQKAMFRNWLQQAGQAGITTVQSIDLLYQRDKGLLQVLQQLYLEASDLPRLQLFCPNGMKVPVKQPQSPEKQPTFSAKLNTFTDLAETKRITGQTVVPLKSQKEVEAFLELLRCRTIPEKNPQRLTLLGCEATGPRQLQELGQAEIGVIAFPGMLDKSLQACASQTSVQLETCCAWRTLSHLGAKVAFGGLDRAAPFAGLQAAVCRKTVNITGESVPSKEALSLTDGLTAMTEGAAWTGFQEMLTGRLQGGYRADLQVLEGDPFVCEETEMGQIRPVLVMSGGRILFRKI